MSYFEKADEAINPFLVKVAYSSTDLGNVLNSGVSSGWEVYQIFDHEGYTIIFRKPPVTNTYADEIRKGVDFWRAQAGRRPDPTADKHSAFDEPMCEDHDSGVLDAEKTTPFKDEVQVKGLRSWGRLDVISGWRAAGYEIKTVVEGKDGFGGYQDITFVKL